MKRQPHPTARIFCQNIRALRKSTGLSIFAMAGRLRISPKTLILLERNILPPKLECTILFRIEDEFGIRPQDMLRSDAEKNPENF